MKLRNGKLILSEIKMNQILENYVAIIERLEKISQTYYSTYIDTDIVSQMQYILQKINDLRNLINSTIENSQFNKNSKLQKYHKLEEIWCELLKWMDSYDKKIQKLRQNVVFPKSHRAQCLICKENFQKKDRICFCTDKMCETSHLYHYKCINECFNYNLQFECKKCPYCRQKFHKYSLSKKIVYTIDE